MNSSGHVCSEMTSKLIALVVCVSGCVRGVYKETRLCLALLYSLLSQYRLREAQELGDHMARLVLPRTGYLNNSTSFSFLCQCAHATSAKISVSIHQ